MKRVVNQNFLTMNNLSKLLKHPNQDYLQTEQKILQVTEPFTNLFNSLSTCTLSTKVGFSFQQNGE